MSNKAIQRYEAARENMARYGTPIAPNVLRAYLDALRTLRSMERGEYYTRRLIITGSWLNGPRQRLAKNIFATAIDQGFTIVSEGEKWPDI